MRYGSSESDQMISGRNIVISGVTVYTNYSIEVATVNSAGVGVYSNPFTIYFNASPGPYYYNANQISVCEIYKFTLIYSRLLQFEW